MAKLNLAISYSSLQCHIFQVSTQPMSECDIRMDQLWEMYKTNMDQRRELHNILMV